MKKIILILAIPFALFSCRKDVNSTNSENIPELQVQNNRMVFRDLATLDHKIAEFDKNGMQASMEFKKQFPGFKNLGELLENAAENHELRKFGFPHYMLSILNESGEFQVGDTIVAYLKGYKYYIPGNDEAILNRIRTDGSFAESYSLRAKAGVMPVTLRSTSQEAVSSVNLGLSSGVDARHQLQFWAQAPAAGWRKYVHEIQSYYDNWVNGAGCNGYVWRSRLYLRMKLEWKGSDWQPAGETRNINYSVGGAVNLMISGTSTAVDTYIINSSGNVTQNYDQVVLLGMFDNQTRCPQGLNLRVSISGSIYQHIVGDAQVNEWNNTGNPLW